MDSINGEKEGGYLEVGGRGRKESLVNQRKEFVSSAKLVYWKQFFKLKGVMVFDSDCRLLRGYSH